jgi:hypothetical protein
MAGIKELKDVVYAGLKIGEALSDGIGIEDIGALTSLPAAIAGISDVPAEIADLDEAEAEELKQYVKDNFDIPDDKLEAFIEQAVETVVKIYALYLAFKAMRDAQTEGGGE